MDFIRFMFICAPKV